MAYPTGSGSEILRRGSIIGLTNQATAVDFDGTDETTKNQVTSAVPALHIVTILNITITDASETTGKKVFMSKRGSTATNVYLLYDIPIGAEETFIWSEKMVLIGGDKLVFNANASANYDISYCYIDQDWS